MSRRLSIVAVVAVVAALALSGCGDDTTSPGTEPTSSPTADSTASPSATGSPSSDTSPSPAAGRIPVYYLGGTQNRPVLYREFRSVPASEAIHDALDAMLHLTPEDSDYYSLWPSATTVLGVTTSGSTATIDLSGNARSVTTSRVNEQASLQQLVHTVTAAKPAIKTIKLTFDGATKPTLWGRVDTTGSIARAASIDTIAPIWVVEPGLGSTVNRTFRVTGTAAVFEATVSWAVTRPGSDAQIAHGFVNASEGAPGRGNFTVDVTLPTGTTGDVVFTAWEDSAEDGRRLFEDSKTYRVS